MLRSEALTFAPWPESVTAARHYLAHTLRQWDLNSLVDVASLAATELTTNAVRHAQTPFTMTIAHTDDLTVSVHDQDHTPVLTPIEVAAFGSVLTDPDENAEGGRGLAMVSLLADTWGIDHDPTGKTVWFTLRIRTAPSDDPMRIDLR